jgi:hypothetical protein
MSTIKVDKIEKRSGSTLTLGGPGTAVTLACGATQTGFGRTGTVDWQTTPKTGDFTGVNGEGYFINTTSDVITMTLPSASAGDIISIQDYNNTFDTNQFTIQAGSGVKINGGTATGKIMLNTEGQGLTLVYVDATVGWRSIESTTFSTSSAIPTYIAATGGTVTTSGNFKIHTFNADTAFCVSAVGNAAGSNTVDYVVVAGGGGGGRDGGGGGGAGGLRTNFPSCNSGLSVSVQSYPVSVGGGGPGAPGPAPGGGPAGSSGVNSTFSSITSAGGGGGGTGPGSSTGVAGGSGGGGARNTTAGGAGNTPPVSPPQGNAGGTGGPNPGGGGGGGGHSAVGVTGPGANGGNGGAGTATTITGSSLTFAGGGGGGAQCAYTAGTGGAGGGAPGNNNNPNIPVTNRSGTDNTGGGGGGESGSIDNGGGNGGSGVVIVRYKFQN